MFSTIDMRSAFPKPQEKPGSIFIDHFRKVSRTKRAKLGSIGKKQTGPKKHRSPLPPLVHDNIISAENTPISTPTHPEFDFRIAQGSINDKNSKVPPGNAPLPPSPLANRYKNQPNANNKAWRGPYPPSAPRIDTGAFDTSFQDSSFDSSASMSFSNDISFSLPSMDRQILPDGLQNLETMFTREELDNLRTELRIDTTVDDTLVGAAVSRSGCVPPPAPRPDTGVWSYMDPPAPGPFLPGVPGWIMTTPGARLPIPPAGMTNWPQPQPRPHRGEFSAYLNPTAATPSLGWNMGHGLDLYAIADIPGPALGENTFMLDCEQCLMELFPRGLPPRGPVLNPPLAWTTASSRVQLDSGRLGSVREALVMEGRTVVQDGYSSASGVRALGYCSEMRGRDSVRADHQLGAQSVWTRPIEPVVLAETAFVDQNGGLLPPIELARRRVGI